MSHRTTRADLTQSLRALRDYAQDLQRARFEDSSTKLRLVVNAGQRDATLRALTERLLRMPGLLATWDQALPADLAVRSHYAVLMGLCGRING